MIIGTFPKVPVIVDFLPKYNDVALLEAQIPEKQKRTVEGKGDEKRASRT